MTKQALLTAAALLALASPAAASQSDVTQRTISLSGYDLNKQADREALAAEIREAAEEVCDPARKVSGSRLSFIGCVQASSRDAMRQLEQRRD